MDGPGNQDIRTTEGDMTEILITGPRLMDLWEIRAY